ncbi:putative UPF0496 protein 2 [Dichanthelium oligosanthes]|uniref:Putative UPF0496 protein 2 n=1 Tax=Dichanthelium oligosanthes TaxID=888268 RepID=A0A1E5WIT8_9POAL|nr:putative UPF0496 protein 2 [Dichanthelium oligosanthes]
MERSSSTPSITPARLPPRRSQLDVDEEYDSAFKSKSFLDLWSHAHRHLSHTLSSSFKQASSKSSTKDYSRHDDDDEVETPAALEQSCSYTVLDDFVLEPSPEVLARGSGRGGRQLRRRRRSRVEKLLIEYFDVTQEACEACSSLLAAIGAARRHHLMLRRLLARLDCGCDGDCSAARDAVAEHVRLDNPLSQGCLSGFHEVHGRCGPLATRLAAAQRRLRRLARAMRVARGTAAAALVAACAAAIVAAVVFAAHAVVGIGAAVSAAGAGPATAVRWATERVSERHYARAGAAVDAAARGAYIVGRDLDTVSRMVRRAHDELEHGRDVARIAVRGRGERPLLQEVAREEAECEKDLRAQLEELEEHVCLCLITINRSRRMVAHEMTGGLPSLEATPSQN